MGLMTLDTVIPQVDGGQRDPRNLGCHMYDINFLDHVLQQTINVFVVFLSNASTDLRNIVLPFEYTMKLMI